MSREEVMLWLEHLANRVESSECKKALEIASWIIYGCSENVVESYSVIASKPTMTRVLLAEGKSIDEVIELLKTKEKGDIK